MTLPTSPSPPPPVFIPRTVVELPQLPQFPPTPPSPPQTPRFNVPEGQYVHGQRLQYARRLGDNELSYYLPSRADGANDMVLHIEFKTSAWILTPQRLSLAWAILRLRHPNMAARLDMSPGKYREARFIYSPPTSPLHALASAAELVECFSPESTPRTISSLLYDIINGPRKLSNDTLSKAFLLRETPVRDTSNGSSEQASFHLCATMTHFIADGLSFHRVGDELLTLLGSGGKPSDGSNGVVPRSDAQLARLLEHEWTIRWGPGSPGSTSNGLDGYVLQKLRPFPKDTEERIPPPLTRLQAIANKVENSRVQEKLIGAHVFPRKAAKTRCSVSSVLSFTASQTKTILSTLKANGVNISDALFAVANLAWIRTTRKHPLLIELGKARIKWDEQPMMMYSAINLRPVLTPSGTSFESYLWLAVSYFNIILPGFLPESRDNNASTFFHRSRVVRKQKETYLSSPFLLSRARELNRERVERSIRFAIEDDAIAEGRPLPPPPPPPLSSSSTTKTTPPTTPTSLPPAPSLALMGITLLGELSHIYAHTVRYPSLKPLRITKHTRKNKGGMLMFSWTLAGEMSVLLGWDTDGFADHVVEDFWDEVRGVFGDVFFGAKEGEEKVGSVRWGEEGGEEFVQRNERGTRRQVVSARM